MFIITNGALLHNYKKSSDKVNDAKNFRLYYLNKETNLIWYDGQIIFLPKEYFELKNLTNIDMNKKQKCILYPLEIALLNELEGQKIQFTLEPNLRELFKRVKIAAFILENSVGVELLDENDYSNLTEPIHLGDGIWLNLENE